MKGKGIAGAVILIFATGCGNLRQGSGFRESSSQPPAAAIKLTAPATVSQEGATTTFPTGNYKPGYEDDRGFYFEAPSKVLVEDIATYAFDGGLYVLRGDTVPTRWYIIRPNGRRTMGRFKTVPVYTLVR